MARKAQVRGIGGYVPDKVLSNADLAEIMDTSDEWIVARSGIHQRHQADDSVMASDLGVVAAQNALADAGMSIADIDLIVVATSTPDFAFPATAAYVQQKLGSSHGAAFDVQAACSGFVYGMSLVSAMIETGQANGVLLIGAELMTRLLDWQDRSTAVLFGDGAGAIVLSGEDVGPDAPQVIKNYIRSAGEYTDLLYATGSANAAAKDAKIHMQGREVYRHAVTNIAEAVTTLLEMAEMDVSEIDWFVPHQANKRIIDGVARKIGLPPEKTILTVDHHANTSAASIPLALNEAVQNGQIKTGDLVMTEAMGGGLSWGANLIRWS
ncbi:MAG: 3-oxoacyl-ACP synthase [Rhodobiaceae bacterium]|nr:3-oxoacyl-ACP synthase [Rhodobiaceae bacterium]OUT94382.1 MAG: 3-oxoacyl-ACP synthase [Rhizobiales bacterium TMED29]